MHTKNTTLKTQSNWKCNALKTEASGATHVTRVTRRRTGKHRVDWLTLGQSFPSSGASTLTPGHGELTRFSLGASLFALKWSGLICFHLKPRIYEGHQKLALNQCASAKTSPTEFSPDHKCSDFPCQSRRHTQSFPLAPTLIIFSSAGRFCVGDKFFLKNNMILCQMDYEEGQLNGSFETQVQ